MSKTLLITLLPSSDVDLGRWLMVHYNISYTERPHAPIFHLLALRLWGVNDYPLLVRDDVKTAGIEKILPLLDGEAPADLKLLPDPEKETALSKEVEELQNYARWKLGTDVVNWSYFNFLKYKRVVWPSLTTDVPWYEKLVWFVGFPIMRSIMYRGLKLDTAVADEALKNIYAGFDKFDALLKDGRQYLAGDRLTFADLALSAAAGPMILAQGYHGMLPNQAMCPVYMQKVYLELRERPTGQFIQRMYDRHRPAQLLCV